MTAGMGTYNQTLSGERGVKRSKNDGHSLTSVMDLAMVGGGRNVRKKRLHLQNREGRMHADDKIGTEGNKRMHVGDGGRCGQCVMVDQQNSDEGHWHMQILSDHKDGGRDHCHPLHERVVSHDDGYVAVSQGGKRAEIGFA